MPPAFRFKHFIWWCLPALIVGAVLRLGLLSAIPETYFGADSRSFFQATEKLWGLDHRLDFSEKRRWIYPLLCLPLPALPCSPALAISISQHLLGLATIFGVGWITAHYTKFRAIWVPLITMLMAIDLDLLSSEHELIADSVFLAAIVGTAASAMPPGSLRQRRRLFGFLLMAAVVAAIKPHGRGFWLGAILAAMLITRHPWRWKYEAWLAVAAGIAVILSCGEKRQADWLLLNSTLPLINLDSPKWSQYRQALKPTVLRARQDFERGQYAWTQREYKVALGWGDPTLIDPVWAELTKRKGRTEYMRVCSDLATEAILGRPLAFAKLTATKIGIAFVKGAPPVRRLDPPIYWWLQGNENQERWSENPEEMRLFYKRDLPDYERLVAERSARRNVTMPFVRWLGDIQQREPLVWSREHLDPVSGIRWLSPGCLGVLAAIGMAFCLRPSRWAETSILWLPAILLLVTVFAIADRKTEYVLPVRWACLVVIAIGLDELVAWVAKRLKSQPRSAIPAGGEMTSP
jgi:hypothetical protein